MGYLWGFLSFFQSKSSWKADEFFLWWLICVVFIYICTCIPFFVILIQICPFLQYLCICTNLCIFHLFPPPSQYLCIGPHPFHTLLPPTPTRRFWSTRVCICKHVLSCIFHQEPVFGIFNFVMCICCYGFTSPFCIGFSHTDLAFDGLQGFSLVD